MGGGSKVIRKRRYSIDYRKVLGAYTKTIAYSSDNLRIDYNY